LNVPIGKAPLAKNNPVVGEFSSITTVIPAQAGIQERFNRKLFYLILFTFCLALVLVESSQLNAKLESKMIENGHASGRIRIMNRTLPFTLFAIVAKPFIILVQSAFSTL
jgi:hypothetical protein